MVSAGRVRAFADDQGQPGVYEFNQDWLFGGVYAGGAEAPGHPESGFSAVTLPHTVTPLSWGDWDVSTWQQAWIYRKHLTGPANAGTRVFVDFEGVMTSAAVFLGGTQIAQHQGGYLPFSVELTQQLVAGANVLAVVVDARWLDVPPDGASAGASAVDYLQPGGIYRDVALRIVPAIHISDVFAKPTNVLSASRGADVQLTIDAASAASGPGGQHRRARRRPGDRLGERHGVSDLQWQYDCDTQCQRPKRYHPVVARHPEAVPGDSGTASERRHPLRRREHRLSRGDVRHRRISPQRPAP